MSKKINDVIYNLVHLRQYMKVSNYYFEKYKQLDEYTGVQSVNMDKVIASGEGKSHIDIIQEKENHYQNYIFYESKVENIYNMLYILDDFDRKLIMDWYCTPKDFREKSDQFAYNRGLSRRSFFRKKKEAMQKIIEHL